MHRDQLNPWGEALDEKLFTRAFAVLGIFGALPGVEPAAERSDEQLLRALRVALAGQGRLDEAPGPLWRVTPQQVEAARGGRLVSAKRLAALWFELLRQQVLAPRLQAVALYDNDAELARAFWQHASLLLHHGLLPEPALDDWRWPLRLCLPTTREHELLRNRLADIQQRSGTMMELTRRDEPGAWTVAEFMLLCGTPTQVLAQLESLPVPQRAQVVLAFCPAPPAPEIVSVAPPDIVDRIQRMTFASAVVFVNLPVEAAISWLHQLVRHMAHDTPIDFALRHDSAIDPPLMFLQPDIFGRTRMRRFTDRTLQAIEDATEVVFDLRGDEGAPIGLPAGPVAAFEVAQRLRDVLGQPGAFDEERRGATWTTKLLRAGERGGLLRAARGHRRTRRGTYGQLGGAAGAPTMADDLEAESDAPRRVQLTTTCDGQPLRRFRRGALNRIEVFIGAQGGAIAAAEAFPEQLLPGDPAGHLLTVTLTAPGCLRQPELRTLLLPRQGDSTRCDFELPVGVRKRQVEARIAIAHLNRTLQTFILSGGTESTRNSAGDEITLRAEMATQTGWGGLEGQTPYGATLVVNRLDGQALATVQAGYRVFGFSIEGLADATAQIEARIDASQWSSAGMQGMQAGGTQDLLRFLARNGSSLWSSVQRHAEGNPQATKLLEQLRDADVIQVLSANLGARLPIEFFYDGPRPKPQARLCRLHAQQIVERRCEGCPDHDRDHHCPARLWSLARRIEWHQFAESNRRLDEFAPRSFALETARSDGARRDRLRPLRSVVVAHSPQAVKVDAGCVRTLVERLQTMGLQVHEATDWDAVEALLTQERPDLLLFLPHVTRGSDTLPALEIGGQMRDEADLEDMDLGAPDGAPGPVVLLIGCGTDNAGAPYNSFPIQLSRRAPVIVSTISHLLGRHAAPLAGDIVAALVAGGGAVPVRLSEAMRRLSCAGLRSGTPPVTLALKCYGDARWWL